MTIIRDVIPHLVRLLAAAPDRQFNIGELATMLGVSRRTLHQQCVERFGMSPGRYLRQRRMKMARVSLLKAEGTTVAEIANLHGFSELGRFAAAYRKTFGEHPSTTLRSR